MSEHGSFFPQQKPLRAARVLSRQFPEGLDPTDPLAKSAFNPDQAVIRNVRTNRLGTFVGPKENKQQVLKSLGRFTRMEFARRKLEERFPTGGVVILDNTELNDPDRGPALVAHEFRHVGFDNIGIKFNPKVSVRLKPLVSKKIDLDQEDIVRLFDAIHFPSEREAASEHLLDRHRLKLEDFLESKSVLKVLSDVEAQAKTFMRRHRTFKGPLPPSKAQVLLKHRSRSLADRVKDFFKTFNEEPLPKKAAPGRATILGK